MPRPATDILSSTSRTTEGATNDAPTLSQPGPAAGAPIQPLMTSAVRNGTTDATPAEPKAETFADDERVCCTLGFGANDLNSQRFFVEGIEFTKARIARGVPYAKAKAIQKVYGGAVFRIHPNDATEADIARRCGIRPGEPAKVAAMLLASNLDEIAKQISPDELEMLARKLRDLSIERNAKHG